MKYLLNNIKLKDKDLYNYMSHLINISNKLNASNISKKDKNTIELELENIDKNYINKFITYWQNSNYTALDLKYYSQGIDNSLKKFFTQTSKELEVIEQNDKINGIETIDIKRDLNIVSCITKFKDKYNNSNLTIAFNSLIKSELNELNKKYFLSLANDNLNLDNLYNYLNTAKINIITTLLNKDKIINLEIDNDINNLLIDSTTNYIDTKEITNLNEKIININDYTFINSLNLKQYNSLNNIDLYNKLIKDISKFNYKEDSFNNFLKNIGSLFKTTTNLSNSEVLSNLVKIYNDSCNLLNIDKSVNLNNASKSNFNECIFLLNGINYIKDKDIKYSPLQSVVNKKDEFNKLMNLYNTHIDNISTEKNAIISYNLSNYQTIYKSLKDIHKRSFIDILKNLRTYYKESKELKEYVNKFSNSFNLNLKESYKMLNSKVESKEEISYIGNIEYIKNIEKVSNELYPNFNGSRVSLENSKNYDIKSDLSNNVIDKSNEVMKDESIDLDESFTYKVEVDNNEVDDDFEISDNQKS